MSRPETCIPRVVDAAVVGAGPGGLSAALYLARFRRSVLVFDGGHSRARRIPLSHNYPGFAQGIAGTELVDAMRAQAGAHGVAVQLGQIETIEPSGEGFVLRWAGGSVQARAVVLASGASDIEPPMPHLAEALREGALRYCPVCDGFEVIDCAVGVIANDAAGVGEALYLRHFTPQVQLLFTRPDPPLSPAQREALAAAGIGLPAGPVERIRLCADARVEAFHGGQRSVFDSLYCALGMRVHSALAARLGAECDADGYVVTDAHQRSSVAGLYAVGDVALGLNQISVATGGAAIAASAIHLSLSEELAARRAA